MNIKFDLNPLVFVNLSYSSWTSMWLPVQSLSPQCKQRPQYPPLFPCGPRCSVLIYHFACCRIYHLLGAHLHCLFDQLRHCGNRVPALPMVHFDGIIWLDHISKDFLDCSVSDWLSLGAPAEIFTFMKFHEIQRLLSWQHPTRWNWNTSKWGEPERQGEHTFKKFQGAARGE